MSVNDTTVKEQAKTVKRLKLPQEEITVEEITYANGSKGYRARYSFYSKRVGKYRTGAPIGDFFHPIDARKAGEASADLQAYYDAKAPRKMSKQAKMLAQRKEKNHA